jgi:hypothetical protein
MSGLSQSSFLSMRQLTPGATKPRYAQGSFLTLPEVRSWEPGSEMIAEHQRFAGLGAQYQYDQPWQGPWLGTEQVPFRERESVDQLLARRQGLSLRGLGMALGGMSPIMLLAGAGALYYFLIHPKK